MIPKLVKQAVEAAEYPSLRMSFLQATQDVVRGEVRIVSTMRYYRDLEGGAGEDATVPGSELTSADTITMAEIAADPELAAAIEVLTTRAIQRRLAK
jgi:hypothetical protein